LSPVNGRQACETGSDMLERYENTVVPGPATLDLLGEGAALSGAELNERSCHEPCSSQMQL
jgi:hypothetical protein